MARSGLRGFTLIELLAVVAIIAILAATATPVAVEQLRDRKVQRAATDVASYFRTARTRALGRGSAHLVRYKAPASGKGVGNLQLFESVQVPGASPAVAAQQVGTCALPVSSCTLTQWPAPGAGDSASSGTRQVSWWPDTALGQDYAQIRVTPPENLNDVCITPTGRLFGRASAAGGGGFTEIRSVPAFSLQRLAVGTDAPIGLTRRVLILPNGSVRVEL